MGASRRLPDCRGAVLRGLPTSGAPESGPGGPREWGGLSLDDLAGSHGLVAVVGLAMGAGQPGPSARSSHGFRPDTPTSPDGPFAPVEGDGDSRSRWTRGRAVVATYRKPSALVETPVLPVRPSSSADGTALKRNPISNHPCLPSIGRLIGTARSASTT